MSFRKTIRLLSTYYRKSARFAVFLILLASFAAPVLASGPLTLNLSSNISVNAVEPFGCGIVGFPPNGYYQAGGGITASGTYSGNVYLSGSITIYGHDRATNKPETQRLVLPAIDLSPNPMNFPSQSSSGVVNSPEESQLELLRAGRRRVHLLGGSL